MKKYIFLSKYSIFNVFNIENTKRQKKNEGKVWLFLSVLHLLQIFPSAFLHIRSLVGFSKSKVRILFLMWLNFAFK